MESDAARLDLHLSPEAADALQRIGRTEDIQFSPDGRMVALVGHLVDRILVLRLEVPATSAAGPVGIGDALELECEAFAFPHGVTWLDDHRLFVANRQGRVVLIDLPEVWPEGPVRVDDFRYIGGASGGLVGTPGSLSASYATDDVIELVVCNNYVHRVSRHFVDATDGSELGAELLAPTRGDVPDGAAHSPSGRLLAVSHHFQNAACIYANDESLGPDAVPLAELRGLTFPHGVRFVGEDVLLAANSGAPSIVVYVAPEGGWDGTTDPAATIQIVSDEDFIRGHYNDFEGGPKGLALHPNNWMLGTTCDEDRLALFDVHRLLAIAGLARSAAEPAPRVDRRSDVLRRCLAGARAERARAEAEQRRLEAELDHYRVHVESLLASTSWRATRPLRAIVGAVRGEKASPRSHRPET